MADVKYTDSKGYFKITFAYDGEVRIKIPKVFKDTEEEMQILLRLEGIMKSFNELVTKPEHTIRGRFSGVDSRICFYYNSSKKTIYKVDKESEEIYLVERDYDE